MSANSALRTQDSGLNSLRAFAQLLRIPNVFTALADICLGWLASGGLNKDDWSPFFFLLGASACLYSAGMVLNDYFDVEVDRKERPFRPIPSGRLSRRTAGWLGVALLCAGLGLARAADGSLGMLIAALLVVCIVFYDSWLKRTPLGPIGMGMCRFLNVLLGQSAGSRLSELESIHLAAVVGVYIVGVTWFARREAEISRRPHLLAATGVMFGAAILALLLPVWWTLPVRTEAWFFPLLLVAWCIVIGLPITNAIRKPEPANVQAAIKRCLMGLVGLDAVLAFAFVGWPGLAILLLLLPALWLGRWVYST
jgi:4-hydroxybenzoate polyprenyltransferase